VKICFASNNANKVKELNEMLGRDYEIIGLKDLNITEDIAETGNTLEENSAIKANYVFKKHKIPVFADDSGLLVEALNGQPGVYSARYAGLERKDERNIDLLLQNLQHHKNRQARFETVITFIEDSGTEYQFKGFVKGEIINERRGSGGFGYDPIFVPDGYNQTFAEMSRENKNKISHRAIAVQKLVAHLQSLK